MKRTTDMTQGSAIKHIVLFALPIMVTNLFQQLYNIADNIMVGKILGVQAFAAIGATVPFYALIAIIGINFTEGLSIITAQKFGAKDFAGMRKSIATSVILTMFCMFLYGLFNLLILDWSLRVMDVPENILGMTKEYVQILCFSTVLIAFLNLLFSFLRAVGNSRPPLYFLIASSILNIGFNYIFIKLLGLGVKGSAYGTALSFAVAIVGCLIYIKIKYPQFIPKKSEWKIDIDFMKKHLGLAVPMTFQYSVIAISIAAVQTACNNMGYQAIAGMAAALRLEILAGQILNAIGVGVKTFSAQNYGAYKAFVEKGLQPQAKQILDRIKQSMAKMAKAVIVIALSIAGITLLFEDYIIGLFLSGDNPEVLKNIHALALQYVHTSMAFYIFLGLLFVYRGACQGMSGTLYPTLAALGEVLMRVLSAFVLAKYFGFTGLCFTGALAFFLAAIITYVGYRKQMTENINVLKIN